MATIGNSLPTFLDQMRGMDPDGAVASVVEALTRRNPVLEDMVVREGNLTDGERVTTRNGLPSIAWRRYNEGVQPSKSRKSQYDETCGQLEGISAVDVKLARLGGNEAAFRSSEDLAFVQAMNNELSTGIFYHSSKTNPERFLGLSPRLDSLTNPYAGQIINADATAAGQDQSSIWLVCWGFDGVYGVYPKGSTGGLQYDDMGKQLWDDGTGKKFRAWVGTWSWDFGLVVKDARQLVRIANVDTSNLKPDASSGASIIDAMIQAYYRLFDPNIGRLAYYCNRTVATYLHLQAKNATKQSTLSLDTDAAGRPIIKMLGIPVRVTDALNTAESIVS
jgi:hypothetical protein